MKLIDLIGLAFSRLGTSRMRTALTMLGVIIGVASVVALVSVGQGSTSNITERLSSLGTNLLTVSPGSSVTAGTFGGRGSSTSLTLEDADALTALGGLAGVAPELTTSQLVIAGDGNTTTSIVGTSADYPAVRTFEVWQGAFLSDIATEHDLRIAVLGASTAEDLGLGADAVGTELSIGGLPFRIVGILQAKGGSGADDPDDMVLIPITTLQKYFSGSDSVRSIYVSVADDVSMDSASTAITAVLRERHELALADDDDFTVRSQEQLLETASAVSGTMTLLLGGIASISLIVGGIGIMNIMLVSVRERTREIGIRKAIGARGRDILAQFLVEAVTLSLLGGLVGVALGIVATVLIGAYGGWGVSLSVATIAVALGFSVATGVIFGVWPARQAARLDPIAALRYE